MRCDLSDLRSLRNHCFGENLAEWLKVLKIRNLGGEIGEKYSVERPQMGEWTISWCQNKCSILVKSSTIYSYVYNQLRCEPHVILGRSKILEKCFIAQTSWVVKKEGNALFLVYFTMPVKDV